jgi:D-glycero-alpha-D-manno-heptose-7-phosphate kinase
VQKTSIIQVNQVLTFEPGDRVTTFVTTRTPFRISFFGGGTDYPTWYRKEGGAVLSTSIDKYCYLTCRHLPPFFPQRHRIVWSHIENVSSIAEILHPAVREGLRMLKFSDAPGIELHHYSDLPARSGMGSSSAFANGLLLALSTLRGQRVEKNELYRLALDLEQNWLRENVGSQDQVATAMGGFNFIRFHQDESIDIEPVNVDPSRIEYLEKRLMLFFTGTNRLASEIAGKVVANMVNHADDLRAMRRMVDEALVLLEGTGDIDQFGSMLDEAWQRKRSLSDGVSNESIDTVYRKARQAGALGGKLLGAGGAGFMVLYVPPDRQHDVSAALDSLLCVPFKFETTGATLLHTSVPESAPRARWKVAEAGI